MASSTHCLLVACSRKPFMDYQEKGTIAFAEGYEIEIKVCYKRVEEIM